MDASAEKDVRNKGESNLRCSIPELRFPSSSRNGVIYAFFINFTEMITIERNLNRPVHCVTKLRNEIYILFRPTSTSHISINPRPAIHVFEDQHPFHLQKKIELTEIIFSDDIGSNEKENCLYVSDFRSKSVWKITREEDDEYKIVKWLTTDYIPHSLSVSTDGRFLALTNFSLLIYRSDAEFVRSIELPTDLMCSLHAVETSIGNFLILHRCMQEKDKSWSDVQEKVESESIMRKRVMQWVISEFTKDGQMTTRRFIPSNKTQQLKNPEYFSIDSADRVFVVDSGNGRVILLDSDLKWNRILIPTREKEEAWIEYPSKLCYDEEKNQLIVVGGHGVRPNVYSIIEICRKLTNEEIEQNANLFRSHTVMYDLPLEILDALLQKSYLHWILNSQTKHRDEEIIRSLMSVDFCFNQRITKKRLKRIIWRYWKDFYGKTKNRYAVIRNNRNYLLENIQPNEELIASLLSHNCITQEQSHLIQRQNSNRKKTAELLNVVKPLDETKFSKFLTCLRQTNQKTVARVIENGGGTQKIDLQSRGAKRTASIVLQLLHKKIEDLLNGTTSWSHQTYKVISQLKEEGIEILNSQLKKQTVVVWFWCRSQTAVEHIQKMYESNQLRDLFFENIHAPLSMLINIDRNQFKKIIVVSAFSINFTQRINIKGDIVGQCMTKLRNEIYILSTSDPDISIRPSPRPAIRVFEDQHPFHLQTKIEITEIIFPDDIGSNEKENCLYVSDFRAKSVWKITREGDDEYKIVKWLTTDYIPQSMSVSTDGRFLALTKFSLLIYRSDAEFVRSIELPTGFMCLHHAVETSIGNFLILHRWMQEKEKSWSNVQEKVESQSNMRKKVMKWVISELTRDGQMTTRRFIPSNKTQHLQNPEYFSIDSYDRVFVVDSGNCRVILLDSDLNWNRILIPTREKEEAWIEYPCARKLCYDEEKKQLIVGGYNQLNVYSISWK